MRMENKQNENKENKENKENEEKIIKKSILSNFNLITSKKKELLSKIQKIEKIVINIIEKNKKIPDEDLKILISCKKEDQYKTYKIKNIISPDPEEITIYKIKESNNIKYQLNVNIIKEKIKKENNNETTNNETKKNENRKKTLNNNDLEYLEELVNIHKICSKYKSKKTNQYWYNVIENPPLEILKEYEENIRKESLFYQEIGTEQKEKYLKINKKLYEIKDIEKKELYLNIMNKMIECIE
jgi:hypothetical protein